jgi:hypothetical protein
VAGAVDVVVAAVVIVELGAVVVVAAVVVVLGAVVVVVVGAVAVVTAAGPVGSVTAGSRPEPPQATRTSVRTTQIDAQRSLGPLPTLLDTARTRDDSIVFLSRPAPYTARPRDRFASSCCFRGASSAP